MPRITTPPRRVGRLKQSLSGNKIMMNHSPNCQHGQPSILNLLQLHSIDLTLALILNHAHRIKPEITRSPIGILPRKHILHGNLALVGPPLLHSRGANNLKHGTDSHGARGQVRVVHVHIGVHREVDELTGNESGGGKHGHAAVLDFGLLQPVHVEVAREVEGVEFSGAHEAHCGGGLGEEGEGFGHFGREGRGGLRWGESGPTTCTYWLDTKTDGQCRFTLRRPVAPTKRTHLHIADGGKGGGAADEGEEGELHHGCVWFR